jgi:hypothetical protein
MPTTHSYTHTNACDTCAVTGAEDLANMFAFKVECNKYYCGIRDLNKVSCMWLTMWAPHYVAWHA